MRRRDAIVGLGGLGLAVGAFAWWRASAAPDALELLHPPLPEAEFTAYAARVRAGAAPAGPDVDQLLAATRDRNRAEAQALSVSVRPPDDPVYRATAEAWRAAAERCLHLRGPAELLAVGRLQGLRLLAALPPLFERARDEAARRVLLSQGDEDPVTQTGIDLGGGLLLFAERGGFLNEDGTFRASQRPLLQAVALAHWGAPLRPRWHLDAHWEAQERVWLDRWRVEWQADGTLEGRLAAAARLEAVPGYPAAYNAGVLLYRAGQLDAASERFRVAPEPEAARALRLAQRGRSLQTLGRSRFG